MGQLVSNEEIEGSEAYKAGKPRAANPYESNTKQHRHWNDGWDSEEEWNE